MTTNNTLVLFQPPCFFFRHDQKKGLSEGYCPDSKYGWKRGSRVTKSYVFLMMDVVCNSHVSATRGLRSAQGKCVQVDHG